MLLRLRIAPRAVVQVARFVASSGGEGLLDRLGNIALYQ